ncbi:hypothetical protein BGZ65_011464, partial [Modicella reniformis]
MSHSQIQWVLANVETEEQVTFTTFVKRFRFSDKQSATEAYLSLINSSQIRQSRREKLREAFVFFQKNHEEDFWANRALQLNSQTSSKKAAVFVQNVGLRQAESAYRHCFSKIDVSTAATPSKPNESENETVIETKHKLLSTTTADASVNKKMRHILQEEMDASQESVAINPQPSEVEGETTNVIGGDGVGDDVEDNADDCVQDEFQSTARTAVELVNGGQYATKSLQENINKT